MQNPGTNDSHSAYYRAVAEADDDLQAAISHVVAEQDAGRISLAEAAVERCELLTRHLERLEQLRRELLGGAE
jgi:hypothetical protein